MKIRNGFVSNSSSSSFVLLVDKNSPHLSKLEKLHNDYLALKRAKCNVNDNDISLFNNKEEWLQFAMKRDHFDENNSEDMEELFEDPMTGLFDLHPNKVIFELSFEYGSQGLATDLIEMFCDVLDIEFFRLYN